MPDHRGLEPGRGDGAAPVQQGVDAPAVGVDEVGLVVAPTRAGSPPNHGGGRPTEETAPVASAAAPR